ncbi:MAG TPA: PHP domain-containing protein [Chloroflexota bacterium]
MRELADQYPFRIVDHHLHTRWSDGRFSAAELLEVAREKGYRIGISDHAGPKQLGIQAHNLDAYVADLRQFDVYRGVEFDVAYGLPFEADRGSELDYFIGSLHGVMRDGQFRPLDGMFRWFQSGGKAAYVPDVDLTDPEVWIDEWLAILRHSFETTPIDILGHPTLTPVLPLDPDPERAYKSAWEERLCALAAEHHVALEISGRYKLPHERLLRTGKDMGVTFAIGSDGHQPGQICDLAYPLQMIDKIGLRPHQVFDVRDKPRARAGVR